MRTAVLPQAKMSRRKVQRFAGEDVSRPRSGTARQNYRVNPLAAIERHLGADQRSICGSAVRVVATRHVYLDVAKAAFGQVRLECGQSFVGFHVRNQTQIELGDGTMRQNSFATRPGV